MVTVEPLCYAGDLTAKTQLTAKCASDNEVSNLRVGIEACHIATNMGRYFPCSFVATLVSGVQYSYASGQQLNILNRLDFGQNSVSGIQTDLSFKLCHACDVRYVTSRANKLM